MKLKSLVAALALTFLAAKAHSDTGVYDVIGDSVPVYNVDIASGTTGTRQVFTAQLSGAATSFLTVLENRKVLTLQNISTNCDIFCQIDLSSTSASGDLSLTAPINLSSTTGIMIGRSGGFMTFGLPARNNEGRVFVPWCNNNGGVGTCKLTVIQGRNR